MVIANNYIYNSGKQTLIESAIGDDIIRGRECLDTFLDGKWYNVIWNKLIRRDFLVNNKLYFINGKIFEDELWAFQLATKLNSMSAINVPFYIYNIHDNSTMTNNTKSVRWQKFLKIIKEMVNWIKEIGLEKDYKVQKFILMKLIQTTNGITSLNLSTFKEIHSNIYFSLSELRNNNYLSFKEYIAYRYLDIKSTRIAYLYKRFMSLIFRILNVFR